MQTVSPALASEPTVAARRLASQLALNGVSSCERLTQEVQELLNEYGVESTVKTLKSTHRVAVNVGPFLIQSKRRQGYWCNGFGWTFYRTCATGFTAEDVETWGGAIASLEPDARFIAFDEAKDFLADPTIDD